LLPGLGSRNRYVYKSKSLQQFSILFALTFALTGLIGVLSSGFGVRLEWWDFRIGFALLKWSVYALMFAAALAVLVAASTPAGTQWKDPRLLAPLTMALLVCVTPYVYKKRFELYPTVADATTNMADPPEFVALVPIREQTAENPLRYRHKEASALQLQYFPDLTTLQSDKSPEEVIADAQAVANQLSLQVIAAVPEEGRLEATDTTFWFGFKDDLIVRARSINGKTQVDIRSASRVGYFDGGLNAKRVRNFMQALHKQNNKTGP
jgi:uncharacterized protein (DUF1499 family)